MGRGAVVVVVVLVVLAGWSARGGALVPGERLSTAGNQGARFVTLGQDP